MNEIKCINKEHRNNPYERITHIGGVNSSGGNWKITQRQAIDHINSGKYKFFVNVGGDRVNVIVAKSRFGNEYIKTENDGDEPNNLLFLPECVS
ncbi:MAG: DUF3892 domain-containing protein [Candidatus Gracilibacteria bacterium]|nr:DUF3892 domain-containing protein [Candidatus Gracilibacteria bacterium]